MPLNDPKSVILPAFPALKKGIINATKSTKQQNPTDELHCLFSCVIIPRSQAKTGVLSEE